MKKIKKYTKAIHIAISHTYYTHYLLMVYLIFSRSTNECRVIPISSEKIRMKDVTSYFQFTREC